MPSLPFSFCWLLAGSLLLGGARADNSAAFAGHCAMAGAAAESAGLPSVPGEDAAWWFLTRELLHAGTGAFWEKDWTEITANGQDPVPFMLQFDALLKAKGIRLVLVPVPAKTSIYPDKVAARFSVDDPVRMAPFVANLREAGLDVLDLEPLFAEERAAGHDMHCQADAHFTPYACERIAALLAAHLLAEAGVEPGARIDLVRGEPETLRIVGDQVPEDRRSELSEELTVRYAGSMQGGKIVPVAPDPSSPVLLLGDSHTLVFQEGASRGMHSDAAGLLDQLQVELKMPLDLVGVRGSGMRAARVQLFRNATSTPGYWDGKKAVVWCFSVREFTQSLDKLVEVPIER